MKIFIIFPVMLMAGCMAQKDFPMFAVHTIDNIGSKSGHTALVDVDQDGDLDFIANRPTHEAVGGDVDNDGDIDICAKPWSTGNEYIYIENLLITETGE